MKTPEQPSGGQTPARSYVLDIRRCIVRSCEGELAEMSYYERNNWVTVEYKCAQCGKEFTVKVEY